MLAATGKDPLTHYMQATLLPARQLQEATQSAQYGGWGGGGPSSPVADESLCEPSALVVVTLCEPVLVVVVSVVFLIRFPATSFISESWILTPVALAKKGMAHCTGRGGVWGAGCVGKYRLAKEPMDGGLSWYLSTGTGRHGHSKAVHARALIAHKVVGGWSHGLSGVRRS